MPRARGRCWAGRPCAQCIRSRAGSGRGAGSAAHAPACAGPGDAAIAAHPAFRRSSAMQRPHDPHDARPVPCCSLATRTAPGRRASTNGRTPRASPIIADAAGQRQLQGTHRIDGRGAPRSRGSGGRQAGRNRRNAPPPSQPRSSWQASAGVQQDTDGDGKPDKTLDDADRANQRELAQRDAEGQLRRRRPSGQ